MRIPGAAEVARPEACGPGESRTEDSTMIDTKRHKALRWLWLALALMEIFTIEVPGARDYAATPYAGTELGAESANDFNSDYLIPHLIERVSPGSRARVTIVRTNRRDELPNDLPIGRSIDNSEAK